MCKYSMHITQYFFIGKTGPYSQKDSNVAAELHDAIVQITTNAIVLTKLAIQLFLAAVVVETNKLRVSPCDFQDPCDYAALAVIYREK